MNHHFAARLICAMIPLFILIVTAVYIVIRTRTRKD